MATRSMFQRMETGDQYAVRVRLVARCHGAALVLEPIGMDRAGDMAVTVAHGCVQATLVIFAYPHTT